MSSSRFSIYFFGVSMSFKTFAPAALVAALFAAMPAQAQTEIMWWHSMGGHGGEQGGDQRSGGECFE